MRVKVFIEEMWGEWIDGFNSWGEEFSRKWEVVKGLRVESDLRSVFKGD